MTGKQLEPVINSLRYFEPHLIVSGLWEGGKVTAKLSIGIVNMTLMTIKVKTGFNSERHTL